jgi:hypothetical protein
MKRDAPKAPTAVHGPLGVTYPSIVKVNVIADCLENQIKSLDLCDENQKRNVDSTDKVLFASVRCTPFGRVRPCEIHELAISLKLRKSCGLDGIPNAFSIFQEDHYYI